MPALEVDGVRVHYEDAGDGEPIVLLHGFTSSYVENWVETGWVRRLLDEGFRVVGMDVRGHGRSTKLYAPAGYETSALAGDVVALLDRLCIDRAHAVGFSMGAGIALQLAMEHPARVGAVVVAGIGDKAIRGLHDAEEISQIERGLKEGAENTGTDDLARRIRRNAERAGNDTAALAAFFERGGWPRDLTSIGHVTGSRSRRPCRAGRVHANGRRAGPRDSGTRDDARGLRPRCRRARSEVRRVGPVLRP